MPITRISITNAMTFDQVTTRLSQQRAVDGLIVVGSASADQMTPASDYDLVLVLSEMPVPLHTGVTHIDGRFTDLVFHTSMQIEQILDATKPFGFWDWTGRLVGWLMNGRVVFDRHGMLQLAQTKVQSANWIVPHRRP